MEYDLSRIESQLKKIDIHDRGPTKNVDYGRNAHQLDLWEILVGLIRQEYSTVVELKY